MVVLGLSIFVDQQTQSTILLILVGYYATEQANEIKLVELVEHESGFFV